MAKQDRDEAKAGCPKYCFQFNVVEWLSLVRFRSPLERAVLIDLIVLMHELRRPIPDDAARLSRACGITKRQFVKVRDALLEAGSIFRSGDGLWSEFISEN